MSAASKAILQRDAQPSAFIYKGYKKRNPFEIVTDEDLADYRREVCRYRDSRVTITIIR